MRLYLDSWKAMSRASEAIAEGLVKLAGDDVPEGKASPLHDMVRCWFHALASVSPPTCRRVQYETH